jgi:drug/metabolite transporter (DMT)-like permease
MTAMSVAGPRLAGMTAPVAAPVSGHMSRRAWWLFAAMALIWGVPYLFIKIAVNEISPAEIVGFRTLIGGLVLLPLALRGGAFRAALRAWPFVLAFGVIEMAIPWLLLGLAEQHVASGFAGLMLATVPIFGTMVAFALGDRTALSRVRVLGLVVGVGGVAALVGLDSLTGTLDPIAVVELLVIALCYAIGPAIAARKLAHVPSMGVIALSLLIAAALYLPVTVHGLGDGLPNAWTISSVLVLGLVCTALAFVLFFQLIAEAGPVRATVITFVNPAVAVALGVVVLGERLTWGIVLGFPLVLLGSYWATRPTRRTTSTEAPPAVDAAGAEVGLEVEDAARDA